ncbi:GntR family transcriptional regulator, partial [Streptomyces sp. AA8]
MHEQAPYLRFADELRKRIEDQEWTPGERLPSRAQLAEECGVTDGIVRRAQEKLIAEGVLTGRAGSGTYVAEPRERVRVVRSPERERTSGSAFEADMAALGKRATWESRSDAMVPAPADIAARLGIPEGDYCV